MYIMPYCKDMVVYGEPFEEGPGACVRMVFIGRPSPLYGIRAALNAFCESMRVSQDFAGSVTELEDTYHFKLVYSDGTDVDDTGLLVKYAIAAYMKLDVERVREWLAMIDSFLAWRAAGEYHGDNGAVSEKPTMAVHNMAGLDTRSITLERTSCPFEIEGEVEHCPVLITDVPPPVYPKRFVIMKVDASGSDKVDIVISGNCKPFAPGLAAKRVPCKSLKRDPADEYAEKFYTLFDFDVAAAENVKLVTESLLEEVFVGSPVILRAPSGGPSEGPAAEFIKTLKECINVLCR